MTKREHMPIELFLEVIENLVYKKEKARVEVSSSPSFQNSEGGHDLIIGYTCHGETTQIPAGRYGKSEYGEFERELDSPTEKGAGALSNELGKGFIVQATKTDTEAYLTVYESPPKESPPNESLEQTIEEEQPSQFDPFQ
jgi:hypothetical protein